MPVESRCAMIASERPENWHCNLALQRVLEEGAECLRECFSLRLQLAADNLGEPVEYTYVCHVIIDLQTSQILPAPRPSVASTVQTKNLITYQQRPIQVC